MSEKMKKCYNKKCDLFNYQLKAHHCEKVYFSLLKTTTDCKNFKKGIEKAEVLKMAYDVAYKKNGDFNISCHKGYKDNLFWEFLYVNNKEKVIYNGYGLKSLYKKSKELLNENIKKV